MEVTRRRRRGHGVVHDGHDGGVGGSDEGEMAGGGDGSGGEGAAIADGGRRP